MAAAPPFPTGVRSDAVHLCPRIERDGKKLRNACVETAFGRLTNIASGYNLQQNASTRQGSHAQPSGGMV